MKELNIKELGNLGVKGFEILFQKEIEEAVEGKCWWQVVGHEENIFMELYEIYTRNSDIERIYNKIQKYYDSLRIKVYKYIEENKNV